MSPPIVSAAWLAEHLDDVRVVDFRWYLSGKSGRAEYAAGHIPGSVYVDLADVSAPVGPGRHPIPSRAQLQSAMRRAGVDAEQHVIVVDDAGGSVAARLWFLLRAHGHARVSLLDGGLAAWSRAGQPLVQELPSVTEGSFVAAERTAQIVDKAAVRDREPRTLLIDVRAAERYRGEVEPVDARPGHIPGAVNAAWSANLQADGTFATPAALRARYEALGAADRPVIVSCGSGVTACHALVAFELAGLDSPRLYEGSYSEWSSDPTLPVETS